MVTFELFVRAGDRAAERPQAASRCRFSRRGWQHPVNEKAAMAHFLPARVSWPDGEPYGRGDALGRFGRYRRGGARQLLSAWCTNRSCSSTRANGWTCCRAAALSRPHDSCNAHEKTIPLRQEGPRAHGGRHGESPRRRATAEAHAFVRMQRATVASVRRLKSPKGNPLEIARIAGITAAKRTSELIPLCHPLALTHVDVSAKLCQNGIEITSEATATGPTGVEMEALVAASVAALTIYDMCKALERGMEITELYRREKIRRPQRVVRALRKACEAMTPMKDVKVLVVDDNALILDLLMKGLAPHCDAQRGRRRRRRAAENRGRAARSGGLRLPHAGARRPAALRKTAHAASRPSRSRSSFWPAAATSRKSCARSSRASRNSSPSRFS